MEIQHRLVYHSKFLYYIVITTELQMGNINKEYKNNMKQFRDTQYQIYSDGKIFNIITKRWIKPYKKLFSKNSIERLSLSLYINGIRKNFLYHRVLAEVYIPNPYNFPQINHKDGNPLNNLLDNLEWCTAKDNNIHAIKTGLR